MDLVANLDRKIRILPRVVFLLWNKYDILITRGDSVFKDLYERIKNDKSIIEIYNKIEEYEDNDTEKGFAYHNYDHVLNVSSIVEDILRLLNYDENFIYKAKIAAILHDTGVLQGKDDHAYRSYEFSLNYFNENSISFDEIDLVLEAIKIHSDGFDTDNIIALVLILADKLDIKKTRVAKAGRNTIGMRQFLYIEDINFKLKEKTLEVNFLVHEDIDLDELSNYYFIKKVFKAIEAFCKKVNLNYIIFVNDKEWILEK